MNNSEQIEIILRFLNTSGSFCDDYRKSKENNSKDRFNVFCLLSDHYYRENFHSDIIRYFLDPNETHTGGSKFLEAFIRVLNKKGKQIDINAYQDAIVVREEGNVEHGKIDILIKGESSRRAIIIENKINKADDRWRQMPRYYDYVTTANKYCVDAIVYIPLQDKVPDKDSWSKIDHEKVDSLLVTLPAYDKFGAINLVDDWLYPAILLSDNLDIVSTLRQYSNLIIKLNQNTINTMVLEKFYNALLEKENLETARSIRDMMKELPYYLTTRIFEKYRNEEKFKPFLKVDLWDDKTNYCAFFEKADIGEHSITIDVYCNDFGYELRLFERNKEISESDYKQIITKIKTLSKFEKREVGNKGNYIGVAKFDFYDEVGVFSYLDEILEELKTISAQLLVSEQ